MSSTGPLSFKDQEGARAQYELVAEYDIGRVDVCAYVVRDRRSLTPQRQDVIVEVRPDLSGQERLDVLRSFERERLVLTELNKLIKRESDEYRGREVVITLYNTPTSFSVPGEKYLHLEYLPSGTVAEYLRTGRCFDEADARIIARDIALAVKAHTSRGVVHRNITPLCVYCIIGDKRVQGAKLGGYHLAQIDDQPETFALDKAKFNPGYLAPEQMQIKQTVATDIYQIGLLLWEMLTGKPRDSRDDTPVTSEALRCSPQMADIVQRTLASGAAGVNTKRLPYTQIDDLINELQYLITNPPPPFLPPVPVNPRSEPQPGFLERNKLIIAGMVGIILLGLALLLTTRQSEPTIEEIRVTAAALAITDTAVAQQAIAALRTTAEAATGTAEQLAIIQTGVAGEARTALAQTAIVEAKGTVMAETASALAAIAQTATSSAVIAANETASVVAGAQTAAAVATAEAELVMSQTAVAAAATAEAELIVTQTAIVVARTSTAERIAVEATNAVITATAAAVRPTATRVRPTVTPIYGLTVSKKPPPSVDTPGCISMGISGINTSGWTLRPDGIRMSASFSSTGDVRLCGFAPGQQFTFTIFDRNGNSVRRGSGIPAREGEIFVGRWGRLN